MGSKILSFNDDSGYTDVRVSSTFEDRCLTIEGTNLQTDDPPIDINLNPAQVKIMMIVMQQWLDRHHKDGK